MTSIINIVIAFTLVVGLVFVLREMHREFLSWRHEREDWLR